MTELESDSEFVEIRISTYFLEHLRSCHEFSNLLLSSKKTKPKEDGFDKYNIFIKVEKKHLDAVKAKLKTGHSRSFILNESQSEIFSQRGENIFSIIKSHHQVIADIFDSDSFSSVFQITPKTCVTSVVGNKPHDLPINSLIIFSSKSPRPQSKYKAVNSAKLIDNRIWEKTTWNLSVNKTLLVEMPHLAYGHIELEFHNIIEECLKALNASGNATSGCIGIKPPNDNDQLLIKFCDSLNKDIKCFDQRLINSSSLKYIVLLLDNVRAQSTVTEELNRNYQNWSSIPAKGAMDYKTTNDFSGGKGAISKSVGRTPSRKSPYIPTHWIQLISFSTQTDPLTAAINEISDQLGQMSTRERDNVTISINCEHLDYLLFFFHEKLMSLIPNLYEQLSQNQGNMYHIQVESQGIIASEISVLTKQVFSKELSIDSFTDRADVQSRLTNITNIFPAVRCTFLKDDSNTIILQSLAMEYIEEVENVFFGDDRTDTVQSGPIPMFGASASVSIGEQGANIVQQEPLPMYGTSISGSTISSFILPGDLLIKVYPESIINTNVEAIVNVIDNDLQVVGGLGNTIADLAGTSLFRNKRLYHPSIVKTKLDTGEVVPTSAGQLLYKNILHVVGPYYNKYQCNENLCQKLISDIIYTCLCQVVNLRCQSLALPLICTGIQGIPTDVCLLGCIDGLKMFTETYSQGSCLQEVHFVDVLQRNCTHIEQFFQIYWPIGEKMNYTPSYVSKEMQFINSLYDLQYLPKGFMQETEQEDEMQVSDYTKYLEY